MFSTFFPKYILDAKQWPKKFKILETGVQDLAAWIQL